MTGNAHPAALNVRSASARTPVHPAITAEGIDQLVEVFYGKIQAHERLGPLFEARVNGRWPEHLAKMKLFWQSVLLKTGDYKGKPVPVHVSQTAIRSDDYGEWLSLFRPVAKDVLGAEAGSAVVVSAERIAQSLWLAGFGTPGCDIPADLKSVKP
ncbi:group III truncated hemoglobin [Roseibium polysiphoniae]|uniref:Group III truncated hemoglobin n=1 Tax=Roseibium polysiphoniae TaxID=2571221 RepID=A0A944GT14_9HYPH|nr:group III truncated hemoglobin [Roseibium polysiphoniae]MBS8261428.1 group III truncated hemoglobin [Roseibium polysiphoniae]